MNHIFSKTIPTSPVKSGGAHVNLTAEGKDVAHKSYTVSATNISYAERSEPLDSHHEFII